ncbi:unnamed protein product [Protopolystoma xenopodis]|uniref:Uncharacterized protein n=1 Tax=Protopolystoma xenopodis TaxID=117903 RepID=A0A3S5AFQ8_9PLAT|nr:unnamed protein product [Protopolystoma xenopodis]
MRLGDWCGLCLLHTTHGDLLRSLPLPKPSIRLLDSLFPPSSERPGGLSGGISRLAASHLIYSREGHLVALVSQRLLVLYTLNGKLCRFTDVALIPVKSEEANLSTNKRPGLATPNEAEVEEEQEVVVDGEERLATIFNFTLVSTHK